MKKLIALLLVFVLAACSGSPTPLGGNSTSLSVSPTTSILTAGSASVTFTASTNSTAQINWTLEPASNGSLSAITRLSVQYTPPLSVNAETTVTLKAKLDDASAEASAKITLEKPSLNVFVDPVNGFDDAPGTQAKPWKTLKRALSSAIAGQTIGLLPGTYSAASGETFDYQVPDGVGIRANSDGVVLQAGNTDQSALTFLGSGSARSLSFKGFSSRNILTKGIEASVVLLRDLRMEVTDKMAASAIEQGRSGELHVENCVFVGPYGTAILVMGSPLEAKLPKLYVEGGSITGAGVGIFGTNAFLTITGLVIKKPARIGLAINDGVTVLVYGVNFEAIDYAIALSEGGNFLTVRNSVLQSGVAVIRVDSDFLGVDLGTSNSDPGRNIILQGQTGLVAFNQLLTVARTIYAVGNVWKPGVQGADASGLYGGLHLPVCFADDVAGGNYIVNTTPDKPQLCLAL